MAKKATKSSAAKKASAKKASAKRGGARAVTNKLLKPSSPKVLSPKVLPGELVTLLDLMRYGVSRFVEAGVVFAHGTTDPVAEAAFIVCEVLHLHPDQFEMFAAARVTAHEGRRILALIEQRIATRKPAAYLVNKAYMRGLPFYVDQRVIVPRSFIGEILGAHFSDRALLQLADPLGVTRVLDLCTGSGCLAILAAHAFPNATVDAVDLSRDALEVAARNVADHDLQSRITLKQGDLLVAVGDERYDIIISNPPYVDAEGMASLPEECLHEPAMAFDGGADGIDLVRRIVDDARAHLTDGGGLLCEIGRCKPALESAFPKLPFLWLDTEDSEGEVFWLSAESLD